MDDEVTLWLERIEHEPDESMRRIWEKYFEKLVRSAKRRLNRIATRTVDEEDIALGALNSFYNGIKDQRFLDVKNRTELWRLLLTLVARKASREVRRSAAIKRGGGEVRGESVFQKSDEAHGLDTVTAVPSDQFAQLVVSELIEKVESLDDKSLTTVVSRKLEGYTNKEIAEELEVVPRTIDRKLARIRQLWSEEIDSS